MSEWPLMLQELYQSGQLSLEEVAENLATIETSASQVSTNTSSSCLKAAATSVDDSTILSSSFIFSTSTKRERQLAIYQWLLDFLRLLPEIVGLIDKALGA
jgi:DNA-binding ferritin-like protein